MNRAQLLFADDFLNNFVFNQCVYIGGRKGGGKTALAYTLACWLLNNGYVDGVISNIPMNIREKVTVPVKKKAIVLDESWIYLTERSSVFRYAAFLRKDHDYLILPAVFPVHRLLMSFSVKRTFNCFSVGIPAWLYTWRIDRMDEKEKGHFLLFHPEFTFGKFDTEAKPSNDGGIVRGIMETSGNILEDDQEEENTNNDNRTIEALEDVMDGVDQSSKELADAVIKIKRIRRR